MGDGDWRKFCSDFVIKVKRLMEKAKRHMGPSLEGEYQKFELKKGMQEDLNDCGLAVICHTHAARVKWAFTDRKVMMIITVKVQTMF